MRYHCGGYTERYLSGGTVTVAYNPEDVSSVWVLEDGVYTEFMIIESRFVGKDLTTVQDLQAAKKTIVKGAARDNLQAQINLAGHIEAIAHSVEGLKKQNRLISKMEAELSENCRKCRTSIKREKCQLRLDTYKKWNFIETLWVLCYY